MPDQAAGVQVPFQIFLELTTGLQDRQKVSAATIKFVADYTHTKPCDLTSDWEAGNFEYFAGIPQRVAMRHIKVDVPVGNAAAIETETWKVWRILNGDFSREAVERFSDTTRQLVAKTVGSDDTSIESTMQNGKLALQRIIDRNRTVTFPDIGNPFDCMSLM
jgi:hypothetical protein